jgi:hypothetical protein
MTHKVAMRRRLADAGVPQPRFAAARSLHEAYAAVETVGFPAVLKPADSGGQRGVFRLDSIDDLEAHLHTALAESPTEETIIESYHEGIELNGLAIARGGHVTPLTLSDRLRPPGIGFGVGWIHVYPSRLFADPIAEAEQAAVSAVHALGLRDGIAFPQLIVGRRRPRLPRRMRGSDPGRSDGRPRAPCRRRRPGRDRLAAGARPRGAGRARDAAVPEAARDQVPDGAARAAAHRQGHERRARSTRCWPFPGVVQADVFLEAGENDQARPPRRRSSAAT